MSNLYIIVDENDNIIWHKTKEDINHKSDFYRVSALRLRNDKWDILIAQRSRNKKLNPWKWWPAVAWTVEKWETYRCNIIKEIKEEIWLENIEIKEWPKLKRLENSQYFLQRFTATVGKKISEFKIQKEELEAIKRISPESLIQDIDKTPNNYLKSMKKYIKIFSE